MRASKANDTRPVRDQLFGPRAWAWSMKLAPHEKFLLFALVEHDHIDRETKQRKAEVWPTHSTLAQMTGLGERTIGRTLKALEAKKLIARTGRRAAYGGAVHYSIIYPDGSAMVTESKDGGSAIDGNRFGHGDRPGSAMVTDKLYKEREGQTREAARRVPHVEEDKFAPLAFARSAHPDDDFDQCGESHTEDEPAPSPSTVQSTETNRSDRFGHHGRTDSDAVEAALDTVFGPVAA